MDVFWAFSVEKMGQYSNHVLCKYGDESYNHFNFRSHNFQYNCHITFIRKFSDTLNEWFHCYMTQVSWWMLPGQFY